MSLGLTKILISNFQFPLSKDLTAENQSEFHSNRHIIQSFHSMIHSRSNHPQSQIGSGSLYFQVSSLTNEKLSKVICIGNIHAGWIVSVHSISTITGNSNESDRPRGLIDYPVRSSFIKLPSNLTTKGEI